MARSSKLKRFRENEELSTITEPLREQISSDNFPLKGKWNKEIFKNENPIVLELGCGKGEYTIGLGEQFPEKNFIGVDIKGSRMWRGAKTAELNKCLNVHFLRTNIEIIDNCFVENEISEIWITFPDPQIKGRRGKHRLTNPTFLNKYKKIIKADAKLFLKTDSEFLYGYTLGVLEGLKAEINYCNHDIYNVTPVPKLATDIKTYYESIFLEQNKPICFVEFQL